MKNTMITLIKNADVYAPAHLGLKDVLLVGDKICRIADHIEGYDGLEDVTLLDAAGRRLLPGFIDLHVHITGGGGESGPASRVPESTLTAFTTAGITTVLGLLGTDGITRSLENLLAKAAALNEEGITVYTLTSAYQYPPVTLTGSVEKDITLIPGMIGVKVAVSDHRSSNPDANALIDLASQARRAGLFSGTAGLVTIHMGSGKEALKPVLDAIRNSDIPAKHFLPTHMARTKQLLEQGAELIRMGGNMDITVGCDEEALYETADKIIYALTLPGVSADHISLTTDGFGSQPKFDAEGNCIGLTYANPKYLHKTVKVLVKKGLSLTTALKMVTSTPADILGKRGVKGCIQAGADADLVLVDQDFAIDGVFAKGKTAIWEKEVLMKGRFE